MANQNKETEIKKPIDVFFEEESEKLRNAIIQTIQESTLPLYVRKVILAQTANELISSINQNIQESAAEYYKSQSDNQKEE